VTPWGGPWTPWWGSVVLLLASLAAMGDRRHPDVQDTGAAGVIVFGVGWLCLTLIVLVP
jgi:hypothetical protein